jgi:RNA-directed DNA polymerase
VVTATWESEPQGEPMGLWVEDGGKSECLPVVGRIEVESRHADREIGLTGDITSHESGPTSTWSLVTKELGEPSKQGKQMTAVASAGAPRCDVVLDWNQIDWGKVEHNVRRLQVRIVKAMGEKRWGKVKALRWLLTHSFSGKALAVRRVTRNRGSKTPGVDGEVWNTPKKKAQAISRLRQRGYRAQPRRRTYIPKKDGKRKRPLGIPTMLDRAMEALYKLALDPIAETTGDPNSYGFRKGRSAADAIAQCFLCFRQKTSPTAVYEGDIRGCFDNFSHEWMLEHIPMDKRILKQWLKAGYIDRNVFHKTEAGTPQGGIASPVLANMALDGLEATIANLPHRGTKRQAKLHLIRYADDFVVTGSSKALLGKDIHPGIVAFLRERGLELSAEKTRLTDIHDGFDFLGQNVRKYKGKLLIKPSKDSVKRFMAKVRAIIKANPCATAGQLITELNPLIRGWTNYHRHVVSSDVFCKVDHDIYLALWRWAKRRHRKKGAHWLRRTYFDARWTFRGRAQDQQGNWRNVNVARPARVPIVRHVKVRSAANPYDPAWEPYFQKRSYRRTETELQEEQSLLYSWRSQDGARPDQTCSFGSIVPSPRPTKGRL